MRSRIQRVSVAFWCRGLLIALILAPALGCGGPKVSYETAEVSGKVLFGGQPLPGGQVTFLSEDGKLTGGSNIEGDGTYKVTAAPLGVVHIAVDNRTLMPKRGPDHGPILGRPGAEAPSDKRGQHYVEIPDKYHDAKTSGLTYTVTPGPQPYDIILAK